MTPIVEGKVLVVDDNPGTRYATARVLRSAGFTVLEAATGTEAVAASPEADLVVLDINLPDIDGLEVCRRIRSNPQTTRTPVVHLSASFVRDQDKARGLNIGADGYLTHPVEAPVLIATVNAFLRARQAEDAMRTSEAKFRAIFDQTPQGIALISDDFVYLEVNPAMCRLLNRPRDQIVGRHNSAFIATGHEQEVFKIVDELSRTGCWRGISTAMRPDAPPLDLEWTISVFNIPGVRLAIVTDITTRRAEEAERERLLESERAARAEAERANRLKDDFLATLSHELRTPLNAIVGWVQILRRSEPDAADVAEGLESIERNVNAQSQLIADLLDISRITSGKLRLELQEVDAGPIVHAALDSARSAAIAKGIRLVTELGPRGSILADPNRLQQIVWNLVNNAVKFTPSGGTVMVGLAYTDKSMALTVSDNGQGIAPEFLPRLFERFTQADASSRRIHGGLGIGLAIVKNLVEMHGGTIRAESAGLGKGSRFIMELPRVPVRTRVNPSPRQAIVSDEGVPASLVPEISLHGVRVLVVDDDADARSILMRLLDEFGAVAADAESVPKALEKLQVFQPQVLVSDIGMPGQDGYDLVRQLRMRADDLARLPAIALTAFTGPENGDRALRAGFQVHLPKPINPMRLVSEIRKLAGRDAV